MSFLFACMTPNIFQALFPGDSFSVSKFLIELGEFITFVRGTPWVKPSEFELSFLARVNLLD